MDRRTFLAGSAGSVAALTTVPVSRSRGQSGRQDEIARPSVSELDEERWNLVDDSSDVHERSFAVTAVTAHERTLVWEDEALREHLDEFTQDTFDETVMTFFASRLEFEGLLSSAVRVSDVEDVAVAEFEDRLAEHGLEAVEAVPVEDPSPDLGSRANTHEYAAEYPVQDIQDEVDVGDSGNRSFDFDDGPLDVTGLLSVWLTGSGVGYVAGGIFPAENYGADDAGSVGSAGTHTDASTGVDLGLTPEQYRRDVVDLVESVS